MRILGYLSLSVVGLIIVGAVAAQLISSGNGHSGASDWAQQREGESIRLLEDDGFEIEKTKERVDYGFDEVEDLLKADFGTTGIYLWPVLSNQKARK